LWNMMLLFLYACALFTGLVIQQQYRLLPVAETGAPKASIPAKGSTVHVESSFADGSFVALHAGQRLYYKAVDKNQRLVSGPYEVDGIKGPIGPAQNGLVPIKGK
jgi:hypothetical protein